ncbi:hypothetical protein GCM10025734_10670 [Kitasatospora paranensis]
MSNEPLSLARALDSFDALWSPRIVTRVNDYDVRVAKVHGDHLWHAHDDTDEFFLVLEGELHIALREPAGERTVVLPKGRSSPSPGARSTGRRHRPGPPSSCSSPRVRRRSVTGTTRSPPMWTRRPATPSTRTPSPTLVRPRDAPDGGRP